MRARAQPRASLAWLYAFIAVSVVVLLLAGPTPARNAVAAATTSTFTPQADARVQENLPASNFWDQDLRTDGDSGLRVETYLRFVVSDLAGPVESAKLRVWAYGTTTDGPEVFPTATVWSERLTWNTRPASAGAAVADKGPITANTWVEFDVTPAVSGNGTYSFGLRQTGTDGVEFYSREDANIGRSPELVIVAGSGGGSDTTPPAAPTGLSASGSTSGVALDWADNSESDLAGYDVYRAGRAAGPFVKLNSALLTTSAYSDAAAPDGVMSHYQVKAVDTSDLASAAASASATMPGNPVVAAVGDIACAPNEPNFNGGQGTATACRHKAVADLLPGAGVVLPVGDLQYNCGGLSDFLSSYDASRWHDFKSYSRPVPGNHEYQTSGGTGCDATAQAKGYFDYFNGVGQTNGPAGERGKGYYSYDVGSWHLVALNSECAVVSCAAGSAQEQWLRQDLAAHDVSCTLAYFHHPLYSSGNYRPGIAAVRPLFQALYDLGADVVVNGHDHIYERFAPQNAQGASDASFGIRQFTVGTGGRLLHAAGSPIANSQALNASTFGLLRLTLRAAAYDWNFVPVAGSTFTDAGTGICHGRPASPPPPSSKPSFAPEADARVQESAPNTNYWNQDLRAVGGAATDVETFLRFNVTGISGTVQSAKLRLFAYTATVAGPSVAPAANGWVERLTWNTRPATLGPPVQTLAAVPANSWIEFDVSSLVTGNGMYSFVLRSTSTDAVDFYSREDLRSPVLELSTG